MKRNKPVSNKELLVRIVIFVVLLIGFTLAFFSTCGQTVSITIPNDTSKVEVVGGTGWLVIHNSKARKLKEGYDNNELNKSKFEECEVYAKELEDERDSCKFNNGVYKEMITDCNRLVNKMIASLDKAEKECDKKIRKLKFFNTLRTFGGGILVVAIIVLVII